MSDVEDKLARILVAELKVAETSITPATRLYDIGAGALDFAQLLVGVEECFGIEISDDEAATIETVGDLVEAVERRRA